MVDESEGVRQECRRFTNELLTRHVIDPNVREYCRHFLAQPGTILNEGPVVGIGYGVYLVFRAAGGGDLERLIALAVALDILNLSIEVLDKIIDEEPPLGEGIWTSARIAIVGGVLQSLAFLALRHMSWATQRTRMTVLRLLSETNIRIACGGDRDLLMAEEDNPTLRESLALSVAKSRALGDCMGRFGAIAAEAPGDIVDACGRFGGYALVVAALVNDLHDARPGSEHKSDIRLKRKTPPVAFLLAKTPGQEFREAKALLRKKSPLTPREEATVRQAIEESGAVHFTGAVAELFRHKARAALQEVEGRVDDVLLCRHLLRWPAGTK